MTKKSSVIIFCLILITVAGVVWMQIAGSYTPIYQTPYQSVETVLHAFVREDDSVLSSCYQMQAEELQENRRVQFAKSAFRVLYPWNLHILGMETAFETDTYTYVGVYYQLSVGVWNKVPCYEYYLVDTSDNQCKIVDEDQYPPEFTQQSQQKEQWEKLKYYQQYKKAATDFARRHPQYAERTYERLLVEVEGANKSTKNSFKNLIMLWSVIAVEGLIVVSVLLIRRKVTKRTAKTKEKTKEKTKKMS